MDSVLARIDHLSLEGERQEFAPIQVKKDLSVVKDLIRLSPKSGEFYGMDFDAIVNYVELNSQSSEYESIEADFHNWFLQRIYQITKIEKVQNPFLYVQYQLKLKQKAHLYDDSDSASGCQLYHGTKSCNIDSICRRNFDWRKLGANGMRSSKFGRGVSFSPSSEYASDYPRFHYEIPQTMIVAKVLKGLRCNGVSDMQIPPLPADTSVKPGDGHVVVKYFDNEYYPEFVIYYSINRGIFLSNFYEMFSQI